MGRREGVRLGVRDEFSVGVVMSSLIGGLEACWVEGSTSTRRVRNSVASIDIGGMSSVGRLVLASFISVAGVTGDVRGRFWADSSSRKMRCAGGGGGAIRTSGSGSGDTDSFDDPSRDMGYWMGVL